jgi:hypothetical protein
MLEDVGRTATLVAAGLALAASVARAEGQVGVGPTGGVLLLDPHLGDYRWETDARPVWGVAALASTGRLAGGARVWRASTSQATGIPGDDRALDVALTGIDAVFELRVATLLGARVLTTTSVGMARLDWSPDELTLADEIGGEPLTVRFEPIRALEGGAGLAVRRSLVWGLEAAAAAERSWFSMETSHRRSDEIVTQRETFGSWTGRVEIARRIVAL